MKGIRILFYGLGIIAALLALVIVTYSAAYWNKILPGVKVLGVNIGNKTGEEAAAMIENQVKEYPVEITLRYHDQEWVKKTEDLKVKLDVPQTVNQAWSVGRKGNILERVGEATESFFNGKDLVVSLNLTENQIENIVDKTAEAIDVELVMPALGVTKVKGKIEVQIVEGSDGLKTDKEWLKREIINRIQTLSKREIEVQVNRLVIELENERAETAKVEAEKIIGKNIILKLDEDEWTIEDEQLIRMISVINGGGFDEAETMKAVENLAKGINRKEQNAIFQFENGVVTEFKPGRDGVEVVITDTAKKIINTYQDLLDGNEVFLELEVKRTPPLTSTEDVNEMGIKELVGRGKSSYTHSIPNRVHNVALASDRLNGIIIPPGEEFSFNQAVGEVSAATGYKSAYIISGGRTILGDGGGVCQVSTTMFRAALDAGLPITERRAHAYRVSYYEEDSLPGIDATVFSPTADLKFKNDTENYLLIQTAADSVNRKLVIDIYGTKDGRVVTMTKPKVWGQTPPPPTIYQDDPTLPLGVTKQVDWAAWGAKASFDYKVERGDQVFERTFYSNYQPWQAVFLRGTAQ